MRTKTQLALGTRVLFTQEVAGCLEGAVGAQGLGEAEFAERLAAAGPALERLKRMLTDGSLPLLNVANSEAVVGEVEQAYAQLSEGARTIVFFGTGGSALGGQALAQFGGWSIPGVTGFKDRGSARPPMVRFYDNLDPHTLPSALARLPLAETRFVVISKSGNTPETLAQAMVAIEAVREAGLGARLPDLFLGITEPHRDGAHNGLRDLFGSLAIPCLDHHPEIGGRFSVLSNVGLLPAVARGADVRRILAGAAAVTTALAAARTPAEFAPVVGAVLGHGLAEARAKRVLVMMPYADRLGRLGHWFVQLWAESLGKQGRGSTPIACLGPLDQHSQLQLFMAGPSEHYLTFIRLAMAGQGPRIDAKLAVEAGIEGLGGRTVGDLVEAQTHAVPQALMQAGRPVRIITIEALDEETIGALLMHLMIETILAGFLWGIDPFDQPAVELAKQLTRERLAGAG